MLYQGNLSTISIKNYLDTIITILYMDVGTYLKRLSVTNHRGSEPGFAHEQAEYS